MRRQLLLAASRRERRSQAADRVVVRQPGILAAIQALATAAIPAHLANSSKNRTKTTNTESAGRGSGSESRRAGEEELGAGGIYGIWERES